MSDWKQITIAKARPVQIEYRVDAGGDVVEIRRVSDISGKLNTMVFPEGSITETRLRGWANGAALIQNALPMLSASQREFMISGATPEEWATWTAKYEEKDA